MNYYLGPWVWDAMDPGRPHWRPPDGTVGLIDLRPVAAQRPGPSASGVGFFATTGTLGADYRLFATRLDAALSPAERSLWSSALGITGQMPGPTLLDVLWDTLSIYGDATRAARAGALTPGRDGVMRLHLGGHGPRNLVRSQRSGPGTRGWPAVLDEYRAGYARIRADAIAGRYRKPDMSPDPDMHRRWLTSLLEVFPNLDYRAVSDGLPDEPPLTRQTVVTDDFNRADEALEASANWALLSGDLNIVGNVVEGTSSGNSNARWTGTALSGANHYAQLLTGTLTASSTHRVMGYCRVDPTADSGYIGGVVRVNNGTRRSQIWKVTAGSESVVAASGSDSGWTASGDTVRFEANGTSLEIFRNGSSAYGPFTDTTYQTQTDVGLQLRATATVQTADDWEAGDLGGGGGGGFIPYPYPRGEFGGMASLAGGIN